MSDRITRITNYIAELEGKSANELSLYFRGTRNSDPNYAHIDEVTFVFPKDYLESEKSKIFANSARERANAFWADESNVEEKGSITYERVCFYHIAEDTIKAARKAGSNSLIKVIECFSRF